MTYANEIPEEISRAVVDKIMARLQSGEGKSLKKIMNEEIRYLLKRTMDNGGYKSWSELVSRPLRTPARPDNRFKHW